NLARKHRVPLLITEHAPWAPWMENYLGARLRTIRAPHQSAFQIAVSNFARETIARFTGDSDRLVVLPTGVDTEVFSPQARGTRTPGQALFVGFRGRGKGVELLLDAMQNVVERKPWLRLVVVGGGFYESYRRQEEELHALASRLNLDGKVEFKG